MAIRWAITGGTWSSTSTWNDGATLGIPTSADDVFSNGFTVLVNTGFTVNSLNNTARGRDIATPLMTSNTTPSPYVAAASGVYGGSEQPYLAFDRNTGTNFGTSGPTGWLSIDFGSGNSIIIDGYTIRATDQQIYNTRNWTLEGSNNNSTWVVLHTVTGATAIPANGTYSVASIGNTNAYRYYRVNISANGGGPETSRIRELELYQPGTTSLSAGGLFNFNTSGVTANMTSIGFNGSPAIFSVTASNGLVTISSPSVSWLTTTSANYLTHTGNCDLTVTAVSLQAVTTPSGGINNSAVISKSSSGLLTVNGNVTGRGGFRTSGNHGIISTNGNTIINGNVEGGLTTSTGSFNNGINQSAGSLIVNGNVIGGLGHSSDAIYFRGTSLVVNGDIFSNYNSANGTPVTYGINTTSVTTITGNILGGLSAQAVGTTNNITINGNISGGTAGGVVLLASNVTNIVGNIIAQASVGISSSSVHVMNIVGNVSASSTANGVFLSNASSQVYLNGNMTNVNGKMAIYAPIIWLDQTGTTQARFFTSGGADRTLYSDNTFPNQPPLSDVRYLTQFGPSNGLTGTLRMASPTDVRSGVATDNTVGTALFDTSQLLAELNVSSDPIAQRLRIAATPEILGQLIAAYKR
jgi:hypothetical protein